MRIVLSLTFWVVHVPHHDTSVNTSKLDDNCCILIGWWKYLFKLHFELFPVNHSDLFGFHCHFVCVYVEEEGGGCGNGFQKSLYSLKMCYVFSNIFDNFSPSHKCYFYCTSITLFTHHNDIAPILMSDGSFVFISFSALYCKRHFKMILK